MKTIVAADLYGVTRALREQFAPLADDTIFVSPWATDECPYASESEAHAAFIAGDGLARYAERIGAVAGGEPAFIVAFSVGASAAWIHTARECAHPASVATLFYGSRIRDHATLTPRCEISAIFAQNEAAFAPADLLPRIAGPRVHAEIVAGTAHGFMNPLSPGYCAAHCAAFLRRIVGARACHRPAGSD